MKIKICISLVLPFLLLATWVSASHPWLGKTLVAKEVKRRWGTDDFNEEKFKAGDSKLRAKMAYSLMTSTKLMGLTAPEIRSKLGDFDGHYFSESYPTYIIQEGRSKDEETWQIVFLIDKDRKTKSIIVHKNCCD